MMDVSDHLEGIAGRRFVLERELEPAGPVREFRARDVLAGGAALVRALVPEAGRTIEPASFAAAFAPAAALEHPRIQPVLAHGVDGGLAWVAHPWTDGVRVRTWIEREHRLPILESVRLLRDVTDALAHAHDLGVVHGRLDPESILWSDTHARVLGLGFAPAFVAAGGASDADARSDLHSIGALAYEVLAGRAPVSPRAPVNAVREHLPPGLARLVERCLSETRPARSSDTRAVQRMLWGLVTPAPGYQGPQLARQAAFLLRGGSSGATAALSRFQAAAIEAPSHATAWAGTAVSSALAACVGDLQPEQARTIAGEAADRAVALDPSLSDAHVAMACARWLASGVFIASRADCEHALELDTKHALARAMLAAAASTERRADVAVSEARRAAHDDPGGIPAVEMCAWVALRARRPEDALAICAPALQLAPSWTLLAAAGAASLLAGRTDEARARIARALELSHGHPWARTLDAWLLARGGRRAAAQSTLAELEQRHDAPSGPPWVRPAWLALVAHELGHDEVADSWRRRARSELDPLLELVPYPSLA